MNHEELIEKAAIKLCPIGIKLIAEEHPIAASRSGNNTVFHHCDIYQGRPSYASCLHVMDHAAAGINAELRPECHAAIAKGTCPAQAMRKEELKAGRALFFVNYQDLVVQRKIAQDAAADTVLFGRRAKETTKGKKFVPTVFDDKGQPIFDKQAAAEAAHEPTKPAKSKPKLEQVGRASDDIMQRVLEKRLENESN